MKHAITSNVYGSIREKRSKDFALWKALCEIIDNSIDAGASHVSVSELNGDVVMTDNGSGFENIPQALIIGESTKFGKIGRFGVGLKDASIRYSSKTIIESNGVKCVADWAGILSKDIEPEAETFPISKTGLTKITWKEFNYTKSIKTDMLSKVYGELIKSNKLDLLINGVNIEPAPLPEFNDLLDQKIIYEGRAAIIKGGVYTPKNQPPNHLKGYNIYYKNRLIEQTREKGIGDNTTSNFCFMVDLLDGDSLSKWELSTNKETVEDVDEFLAFIYHKYTKDMLQKAFDKQQTIELKEWEKELQCIVNGKEYKKVNDANESRKPKNKNSDNPADSTGKGSKHTKTNTADGRLDDREGEEQKSSIKEGPTRVNSKIAIKFEQLDESELINIVFNKNANRCTVTFNDALEEISSRKGKDAFFFKTVACSFYYFKTMLPKDTVDNSDIIDEIIKKVTE
jgi:hypothetical protein